MRLVGFRKMVEWGLVELARNPGTHQDCVAGLLLPQCSQIVYLRNMWDQQNSFMGPRKTPIYFLLSLNFAIVDSRHPSFERGGSTLPVLGH